MVLESTVNGDLSNIKEIFNKYKVCIETTQNANIWCGSSRNNLYNKGTEFFNTYYNSLIEQLSNLQEAVKLFNEYNVLNNKIKQLKNQLSNVEDDKVDEINNKINNTTSEINEKKLQIESKLFVIISKIINKVSSDSSILSSNDNSIGLENGNENNLSNTKYISKGNFVVTTNNKKYDLDDQSYNLLCAIVAAECDKTADDALAVSSVILNRCEASNWVKSHGSNPIKQATAPNQFVVYQEGYYKKYLGNNCPETVKNSVKDALNGVRNNKFLSFRSNQSSSYSSNMITKTGNRYK